MRTYVLPILAFLFLLSLIIIDSASNWPELTQEDDLIYLSFITILITMNYALMAKYESNNIFRDYKILVVLPFTPYQIYPKELTFFALRPQNLILLVAVIIPLVYFNWNIGFFGGFSLSVGIAIYYLFMLFNLIIIRYLCGHNTRGSSTFSMLCILISSIALLQILLVEYRASSKIVSYFVEKNPLNTLYLFPVVKNCQFEVSIIYYLIYLAIMLPLLRHTRWERQLKHT